VSTVKTDQV